MAFNVKDLKDFNDFMNGYGKPKEKIISALDNPMKTLRDVQMAIQQIKFLKYSEIDEMGFDKMLEKSTEAYITASKIFNHAPDLYDTDVINEAAKLYKSIVEAMECMKDEA